MKNRKKLLLFSLAALLCANMMAETASAVEIPSATSTNQVISPMTEETEWVYRSYNGKYQRRLWSITYGYWLTDWIDCVV